MVDQLAIQNKLNFFFIWRIIYYNLKKFYKKIILYTDFFFFDNLLVNFR